MKPAHLALAAALLLAPAAAFAHAPDTGPNGGQRTDAGAYHKELVVTGDEVALYVTDGAYQPVDVTGAKAEATVLVDKKAHKVALVPTGGNALKGQAPLGGPHAGVKVVIVLTMPGQKPVQARFEVGHTGR